MMGYVCMSFIRCYVHDGLCVYVIDKVLCP